MADINAVISWGIGTPGDIPHFILDGLNVNLVAAVDATADWHVRCRADDTTVQAHPDDLVVRVPADDVSSQT